MLRLASDADAHGPIVEGLRLREPGLDLVRVVDALGEGVSDPEVLEWAADQDRVLISNDKNTLIHFAWTRHESGLPVPGIIALRERAKTQVGQAIADILLVAQCYSAEEMREKVVEWVPL